MRNFEDFWKLIETVESSKFLNQPILSMLYRNSIHLIFNAFKEESKFSWIPIEQFITFPKQVNRKNSIPLRIIYIYRKFDKVQKVWNSFEFYELLSVVSGSCLDNHQNMILLFFWLDNRQRVFECLETLLTHNSYTSLWS